MGNLVGQQISQAQVPKDNDPNPEVAWWLKLLVKFGGIIAGFTAILTGVWTCVTTTIACILAGMIQMLLGLLVLIFEAPFCCQVIPAFSPIITFAENRTFFQKAIIYGGVSIMPLAMCFGLSTIFGSGLIFAVGVLYGLMALGKKADRDQMAKNAAGTSQVPESVVPEDHGANLVENEVGGGAYQPPPFQSAGGDFGGSSGYNQYGN